MYSNSYIFRYAAILVVLVAAVLSAAALLLKPAQERNVAIAKMQGILSAAHVEASAADAISLYDKNIVEEDVINSDGTVESIYKNGKFEKGETRAFEIDLKKELYNKATGKPFLLPLYVAEIDGKSVYIIPMQGKGLWGPIYGNLALDGDFNTVFGATFSHDKETPGLGAEIDKSFFEEQFVGKKIFGDDGKFTSILVVKGGAKRCYLKMSRYTV